MKKYSLNHLLRENLLNEYFTKNTKKLKSSNKYKINVNTKKLLDLNNQYHPHDQMF